MSKPDDISQEAWDATESVRISYAMPDPNEVREVVARAIMAATLAEREACEEVANGYASNTSEASNNDIRMCANWIAVDINKRNSLPNPLDPQ